MFINVCRHGEQLFRRRGPHALRRAAVMFALSLEFFALVPVASTGAQGPGTRITGESVFPVQSASVNVSVLARQQALNPPVPPKRKIAPRPLPRVAEGTTEPTPPATTHPQLLAPLGPSLPSPGASPSFQALLDSGHLIPPDTMGAVGLNYVVTLLNDRMRVQDRTGTVISTVTSDSFWAPVLPASTQGTFDPHIVYDPFENRWIAIMASDAGNSDSSLDIGVSQTDDPTGTWYLFRFDVDSKNQLWLDYPMLGFNKDWIVVSGNMFRNVLNTFSRAQIVAFNKAKLYSGDNSGSTVFTSGLSGVFSLQPAATYDNSLDTVFLVQDSSDSGGTLRISTLVGSPPSAPTLNVDTALVTSGLGGWVAPTADFLPQNGTTAKIDIGDARVQKAVVRTVGGQTSLWLTQNIALPATAPTHAAVQWWQVDPGSGSSATVLQQGRIEDPTATQTNGGKHYAYGSLAVNAVNDVLIGYSRFSSADYATAAYAFRSSADPPSTLRDEVVLQPGLGIYIKTFGYGSNRWGDFSHTVPDPVNDLDFWTIQEYADTPTGDGTVDGNGTWATWWGRIVAPRADLDVTKTAPADIGTGENLTYTLTLSNLGPDDAQTVSLNDPLPAGTTLVSHTQTAGPPFALLDAENVLTDTIATLPAGASASFEIVAQVSTSLANGTVLTNTATATMSTADGTPDDDNHTSTATTTVHGGPDLVMIKTHAANFRQGQAGATYTLTVTNMGGAASSGLITVTDQLPTSLSATDMGGNGWDCTFSSLQCIRSDPLAAGDPYPPITLTVNVVNDAPASVTNTATVSGGGELNTTNDTASDPTTIDQAPVVTLDPSSQDVWTGTDVTFTAAASGSPTPTVQWQESADAGLTWVDINGATSTSLILPIDPSMNQYQYRAVFTNYVNSVTTTPATLTVRYPPTVTLQPADQTVVHGQPVTFTVDADANPAPTIEWEVSTDSGATWSPVANSNTLVLNFIAQRTQNGSSYRAVFTNDGGSATSDAATLTVNKAGTTTVITSHVPNPSAPGEAVTIGVAVTAVPPGSGTPTGIVTVAVEGSTTSCTITLPSTACQLTPEGSGSKTLTATYSGDGSFMVSTSAGVTQSISKKLLYLPFIAR